MSLNIQDIRENINSLENQINAADLLEQAIPAALEILEEYGRVIEEHHGTQDLQETWNRVYSYCINVEINELDRRIQSLSPQNSPEEVRQIVRLHASLSRRGHLSESQQRFLKDLQDVLKPMSERLGEKKASPSQQPQAQPPQPQEISLDESGLGDLRYLPSEALANILSFLPLEDLCQVLRLSKKFKLFSSDEMFWKAFASVIAEKRVIQSLKNGCFTTKTILENTEVGQFQVEGGRLFANPNNSGPIEVFDLKTMDRLHPDSHLKGGFGFQVSDNHLFSVDEDIEIWDLDTMKIVSKLKKTQGIQCSCIQVKGPLLFAGFADGSIRVWNWRTMDLLHTSKIHDFTVWNLQVEGDLLFSIDYCDNIKVTNWETNLEVVDLSRHLEVVNLSSDPVYCFQVAGDLVVLYNRESGSINVINWKADQSIAFVVKSKDTILCMELVGNLVFCGHKNGTVEVRDLKTLKLLTEFKVQGSVICMQLIGGRLFCASCDDDGKARVKIFDFNVPLAESQQQFLKDLEDVLKPMSETLEEDQSGFGDFSYLPREALVNILSFLPLEDLCQVLRLSKEFNLLSSDKMLWKLLASAVAEKRAIKNLKNGFFTTNTILYNLEVRQVQVVGDRLFVRTGSDIRVFDLKTMNRLDHDTINCVFDFQISDNHLFSTNGSNIEIWDLNTMKIVCKLEENVSCCYCLQVKGDLLFAGSEDGNILIWNWRTKDLLHTLKIHDLTVHSLQVEGDLLFSTDLHNKIKVTNWKTNLEVINLTRHMPTVYSFQVAGDLVVLCNRESGSVSVINWKTDQSIASAVKNKDTILCIEVVRNLVFCGDQDGTIEVRDLKTLKLLAVFRGPPGSVDCLQFIGGRLFCGSCPLNGGRIKIFDFNATLAETFKEIALELLAAQPDLEHFDMLPKGIKQAVYDELSRITPLEANYPGCAEDTFFGRDGLGSSVTGGQRIEAINNSLVSYVMDLLAQDKTDEAVREFEHLPREIQQAILAQNMTEEQRDLLKSKYQAN
jgi:WD40 repeat protein